MITIESVRLRNFRAVREAYFQPLEKGITGIFGTNGAGKTTILAGVMFALFGIRPPRASIASLRRSNAGKDEECSVSVVFKHMGEQIEVIRELKGSNNRAVLSIYLEGVEQTTTSIGAGEAWVTQRLGIDATGFLTAFVVRQKELDQLVNARPAERKAIIERLAGIETINEALKKARKDENTAKDVLENLPGSVKAIEDAEAQVLLLTTKVEELEITRDTARNNLSTNQTSEKTTTLELDKLKTLETSILRDATQLKYLEESNKTHEQNLGRLGYLDNVTEDFDILSLRQSHKNLLSEISDKNQALNALQVRNSTVKNKIFDFNERITSVKAVIDRSAVDPSLEQGFLAEVENLEELLDQLIAQRSSANTRAADLEESIATLQHGTECPTCHTHLDDPAKLIASLQEMANAFFLEASTASKEKTKTELKLEETGILLKEISTFNTNVKELEKLRADLTDVELNAVSEESIKTLDLEIQELNSEKEKITELGIRAKNLLEDQSLKTETTKKLSENAQLINELERTLEADRKSFSSDKLAKLQTLQNALRNEAQNLGSLLNESYADYSSYQSRLTIANNTYKSVTEQWNRKQELLKALEKRALTTEVIDKFRRESVASLTPELSENATELISDITNGAFTDIKIDDDFNISVINSLGDERTIGELSGGEESAVALSLRLAIGLLITGGAPELLWLDEVLTAQDTDRRAAMLSTIRGLPYKQIIMINHTQDAADIVDKALTVVADLEKGSTLSTLSDSAATIEAMFDAIEIEE
jgi:exonuclease SbcC